MASYCLLIPGPVRFVFLYLKEGKKKLWQNIRKKQKSELQSAHVHVVINLIFFFFC